MTPRIVAGVLAVALLLTGCSDDDEPEARGGSSTPSAETDPAAVAARSLTEQVLGGEEAPEPLATVTGALPVTGGSAPVVVDVLEVRAATDSTLLRWRLRSPGAERVRVYTSALSRPNRFDTRAVTLVDEAGRQRLQPFTFVPQKSELDLECVCSGLPDEVGETGALMYGLYPPLAPTATTVDVLIPGVQPARGVLVTR